MTAFRAGDRIRVERTGDDGLPLVRYGFVGGIPSGIGPIVVMLDGDLNGSIIEPDEVEHVELTTVELNLTGADYETIGRELGLTNGSLRGLLHRGLAMLREQLTRTDRRSP